MLFAKTFWYLEAREPWRAGERSACVLGLESQQRAFWVHGMWSSEGTPQHRTAMCGGPLLIPQVVCRRTGALLKSGRRGSCEGPWGGARGGRRPFLRRQSEEPRLREPEVWGAPGGCACPDSVATSLTARTGALTRSRRQALFFPFNSRLSSFPFALSLLWQIEA